MKKVVPVLAGLVTMAAISALNPKPVYAITLYSWSGSHSPGVNYLYTTGQGEEEKEMVSPANGPALSSFTITDRVKSLGLPRWVGTGPFTASSTTVWAGDGLPRNEVLAIQMNETMSTSSALGTAYHFLDATSTGPASSINIDDHETYLWDNQEIIDIDQIVTTEELGVLNYYNFSHSLTVDVTLICDDGTVTASIIDSASGQTVLTP